METPNKITYLLFGSIPVTILEDHGFDEFIKELRIDGELYEGVIYVHDDSENSVVDLLNAYDGWQKFAVLTMDQYIAIEQAIEPNLKEFVFKAEQTVRATNMDQAKLMFAESSYNFAADADCEEVKR